MRRPSPNSLRGLAVAIGGVILLVVTSGCAGDRIAVSKRSILAWGAEEDYSQVRAALGDEVWTVRSDIETAITYCWAQFQSASRSANCDFGEGTQPEVVRFGSALVAIWEGRLGDASGALRDLGTEPEWSIWAEFGFLEMASHTENLTELTTRIDEIKLDVAADPAQEGLLRQYAITAARNSADWAAHGEVLGEFSTDEVTASPTLFGVAAQLLIAEGEPDQLSQLVASADPSIENSVTYLLSTAEAQTRVGESDWLSAVDSAFQKNPDSRTLRLERALAHLLYGSQQEAEQAASEIGALTSRYSHDVRFIMDTAITLALYGQPEFSERVYRLVDFVGKDLEEFASLHVLAVWNAVYRGNLASAKSSLGSALEMSPMSVQANYLKALIAKDQADSGAALEAVTALIHAEPHNENISSLVADFRQMFGTAEWDRVFTEVESWTR